MITRFEPSRILNPSAAIIVLAVAGALWMDRYERSILIAGGVTAGIYIGSAWRGAYESWIRQVFSFYRDDVWISEKARMAYQLRYELLAWYLLKTVSKLIFFVIVLANVGAFFWGVGLAYKSGVSMWIVAPLAGLVTPIIPTVLFLIYTKLKSGKSFVARGEKLLAEYASLDDQLRLLQEYDDSMRRLMQTIKTRTVSENPETPVDGSLRRS